MSIKSRLQHGESLFGSFLSIPHPAAAEVCARQGVDALCIDAEHGAFDRADIAAMVRGCEIGGATAIVRVPDPTPTWIGGALDAGAEAILIPRVSSAEEARRCADLGHYPPLGSRGAGPGRGSGYGYDLMRAVGEGTERTLIAVQIETAAGLDAVDDIAAVDGVDMLFVGPFDLALSINALGEENADRLEAAICRVAEAGRKHGKMLGLFRPSCADVPRWEAEGFHFFLVGGDAMFMGLGLANAVTAFRARQP